MKNRLRTNNFSNFRFAEIQRKFRIDDFLIFKFADIQILKIELSFGLKRIKKDTRITLVCGIKKGISRNGLLTSGV